MPLENVLIATSLENKAHFKSRELTLFKQIVTDSTFIVF